MTKFLITDENTEGYKLEDILLAIRRDMLERCGKVVDDHRGEALHVMDNNMKILALLSEAIGIATDSTAVLNRAFGPSTSADGGEPRIGVS
ncbi:MAG: histidine kinase [Rhodospirillaceae bacterium]|nr:histidine kinase [Rhodospirillaceae bacterium]MBT4590159.1 histidine kinase [Rhodospirillaceae bacterium]MBT4939061.1 histidine kinase [Rhodospirillaceae bacterium]MBT5940540.1 histidine kinase [Rhodospirillaceae bacterium]MBT7269159.1 histidine kinase [Rhodospirillaceae bacterium]